MGGEYDEIDVEGGEEDNVIDVSDLTAAQEEANNDINNLDDKFAQLTDFSEKLTKLLDKITTKTEEQENELQAVKRELEKRLPTPTEKLMIRSADSYPYNVQISDYWKERSKRGDKYSIDINNKDEIPEKEEYVLTDEDVDNFSDIDGYESFNKNLRDLVGF
jgi:chromosome segregation ATPase